jgi:hypothetical protein
LEELMCNSIEAKFRCTIGLIAIRSHLCNLRMSARHQSIGSIDHSMLKYRCSLCIVE